MYLYKCSCGSESLIASPGSMRCDCGGRPELVSGKHHPVLCGDLKKDLQSLARLTYEASETYGGAYFSTGHAPNSDKAFAATQVGNEFVRERHESEPKILPCPFCGSETAPTLTTAAESEGIDQVADDFVSVCCRVGSLGGCGAASGFFPTSEQAISAWNGRAGK